MPMNSASTYSGHTRRVACGRVEGDAGGRERDHAQAEGRHEAPVAMVGGVPGGQREQQRRHELGQADQPQHERLAAADVSLPPERGLHRQRRRGREQLAREQQDEAALHA